MAEARNLRVIEWSGTGSEDLLGEYLSTLSGRSAATVDAGGVGAGVRNLAPCDGVS